MVKQFWVDGGSFDHYWPLLLTYVVDCISTERPLLGLNLYTPTLLAWTSLGQEQYVNIGQNLVKSVGMFQTPANVRS